MTSRSWTADNGARISGAIDLISRAVLSGAVGPGLAPVDLAGLGGEANRLYRAALIDSADASWVPLQFPRGFDSLIDRVNSQLTALGADVRVRNAKREHVPYLTHSARELEILFAMRDEYLRGETSADDAVRRLGEDFRVRLSEGQRAVYFPPRDGLPDPRLLEAKKRLIGGRARALKSYFQLDLSDADCCKGLLFERFAGCLLSVIHGADQLSEQVRVDVPYRDLSGNRHSAAYLDFLVHPALIVEIKWSNSFENIITSVLPQMEGLSHRLGYRPQAMVIHRHPCPDMQLAIRYDISVEPEAQAMGLDTLGAPVRALVAYVSVEELIARLDDGAAKDGFTAALAVVDRLAASEDVPRMRAAARSLDRISSRPGVMLDGLAAFGARITSGTVPGDSELDALFGPRPERAAAPESSDARILAIARSKARQLDGILLDAYNLHAGTAERQLTPEMVERLAALQSTDLDAVFLELFAARETRQKVRRDAAAQRRNEVCLADRWEDLSNRFHDRSRETERERLRLVVDHAEKRWEALRTHFDRWRSAERFAAGPPDPKDSGVQRAAARVLAAAGKTNVPPVAAAELIRKLVSFGVETVEAVGAHILAFARDRYPYSGHPQNVLVDPTPGRTVIGMISECIDMIERAEAEVFGRSGLSEAQVRALRDPAFPNRLSSNERRILRMIVPAIEFTREYWTLDILTHIAQLADRLEEVARGLGEQQIMGHFRAIQRLDDLAAGPPLAPTEPGVWALYLEAELTRMKYSCRTAGDDGPRVLRDVGDLLSPRGRLRFVTGEFKFDLGSIERAGAHTEPLQLEAHYHRLRRQLAESATRVAEMFEGVSSESVGEVLETVAIGARIDRESLGTTARAVIGICMPGERIADRTLFELERGANFEAIFDAAWRIRCVQRRAFTEFLERAVFLGRILDEIDPALAAASLRASPFPPALFDLPLAEFAGELARLRDAREDFFRTAMENRRAVLPG